MTKQRPYPNEATYLRCLKTTIRRRLNELKATLREFTAQPPRKLIARMIRKIEAAQSQIDELFGDSE